MPSALAVAASRELTSFQTPQLCRLICMVCTAAIRQSPAYQCHSLVETRGKWSKIWGIAMFEQRNLHVT